jgi:hypothetical protein
MLRRDAIEAIGGFPADTFMFGEEMLLGARLRVAGYEVWYEPAGQVTHLRNASGAQRWRATDRRLLVKAATARALSEAMEPSTYRLWCLVAGAGTLMEGFGSAPPLGSLRNHGALARCHLAATWRNFGPCTRIESELLKDKAKDR